MSGTNLDFHDRSALVTGAGAGLGRAHARLLASRGAAVVVNDLGTAVDGSGSSPSGAAAVVEEIRAAGGIAVADHHSVATPEGAEAMVQAALDEFDRLDIVVNNAGILRDATIVNATPESIDAVLDVHLKGAFNVVRSAWPHMTARQHGRIVNTSSNSGILGNFGQSNYAAAKMGLVGLTKVLAIEGANRGIKVNAIAPIARTRMTEHVLGDLAEAGDPAFAAALVVLLASDDCPTSGEVWSVGGGRIARYFVGLTRGWSCRSEAPEPEEILAHLDEIEDRESFRVLPDAMAELDLLRQLQPTARTPVHASVPQEAT
jgi:NAD(P)-dependent dehydrogenase (short-subunit alcohol dehydrogenase family)